MGAFSSARLYTMIQSGTDNSPISAIPAAIATDTKLFLGLWASAGQTIIDNEIAALTSAIEQYGEGSQAVSTASLLDLRIFTVSRQLVSRTTQPELEPDQHRSSATFNKLERLFPALRWPRWQSDTLIPGMSGETAPTLPLLMRPISSA